MEPVATVMWFRRDLRLFDHPALMAAAEATAGRGVVPLFVLDDRLLGPSGAARVAFLLRSLRALDADLRAHGGALVMRRGRPETVVPAVAAETGAAEVHASADFGPYGAARDERVRRALGPIRLVATGSPYAVAPGRVTTQAGKPFQVFGPFYRAWLAHGWRAPAQSDPATITWQVLGSDPLLEEPSAAVDLRLPTAGERAAHDAWEAFRDRVHDYARDRDRVDLEGTSRLSPYLKLGALHPRTLLAGLGHDDGSESFRRELAWREFYAGVLHAWPQSARDYLRPQLRAMPYATGPQLRERLDAWQRGVTGYPIVDAGMRQLLAEGWLPNRVRMLVASFLVKDLQVEWTHGARHFMRHLVDGDLASNQHNWQWVAGCGTDAAPYFRIFNPVTQAERFDPDGDYVRRWVPELRDLPGKSAHRPWARPAGSPPGYPPPIVDHAEQREAALAAYRTLTRPGR